MTPLEAAARALAAENRDDWDAMNERWRNVDRRRARLALTAAVPAIPEKRLDALRFAVTPEEVRGVLLRALVGDYAPPHD